MRHQHKRRPLRRCKGRVIFLDEIAAKVVLSKRILWDRGEKRAYKCESGNHWHLSASAAPDRNDKSAEQLHPERA